MRIVLRLLLASTLFDFSWKRTYWGTAMAARIAITTIRSIKVRPARRFRRQRMALRIGVVTVDLESVYTQFSVYTRHRIAQ